MSDKRHSPEFAETARLNAQRIWADPDYRHRHGELVRSRMDCPEVRAKISLGTRKGQAVPGVRERQRAGIIAAMADPAVRAHISAATIAGIERRRMAILGELQAVWRKADKTTRGRFLKEIGS
jgi:hypothetical protein